MMFEEGVLNFILKCPNCNESYNDAKILPCGIYCKSCVDKKIPENDSSVEFECQFCTEKHLVPTNGFMSYDLIKKLNQCKPNFSLDDIYRGEAVQKLKENLKSIDRQKKQLHEDFENCVPVIKKHCSYLRDNVDKQCERLIAEIRRTQVGLIVVIEQYEAEAISIFEKNEEQKNEIISFKNELESYYQNWNNYLKMYQITEAEIIKANEKATQYFKEISIKNTKFEEFTFGPRKLNYSSSNENHLKKNVLGELDLKLLHPISINDFNQQTINDLFIPNFYKAKTSPTIVKMKSTNNNTVCLISNNDNLSLGIIRNKDYKIDKIKSIDDISKSYDSYHHYQSSRKAIFTADNDSIIVFIYRDKGCYNEYFLLKLDLDFKILKSIRTTLKFYSICAYSSKIYCLSDSGVRIFNLDTLDLFSEKVKYYDYPFNENSEEFENYVQPYLKEIKEIQIKHNTIFLLLSNGKIVIKNMFNFDCDIDETIEHVKIKSLNFDTNGDLYVFDSDKIYKYNDYGEMIEKSEIVGFDNNLDYLIDNNDYIIFYDRYNFYNASLKKLFLK